MAIMIPSIEPITDEQINKLIKVFVTKLRRHKNELLANVIENMLRDPMLGDRLYKRFRTLVEVDNNMAVRTVTVNRKRSAREALKATRREQYVTDSLVAKMPKGTATKVEVIFFKLGRYVTHAELNKEYKLRHLKPADPFALAAVNQADPAFADEKPNITQWKNEKGKYCHISFSSDKIERDVAIREGDDHFHDEWWFAGVRK